MKLLAICILPLLLVTSGPVAADSRPFWVWAPVVYPSTITYNKMKPYLDILAEVLQRPVNLRLYHDISELLQHCADRRVDHALLGSRHARQVMEHCGLRVVGVARQPYLLYTARGGTTHDLSQIRTIAVHKPSSGRQIVMEELDFDGSHYTVVDYGDLLTAVSDLLNSGIDALVSIAGPIDNLSPQLNRQLEVAYRFQIQSEAYALVSPALSDREARDVARVITGDNPAVLDVFQHHFGIGRYRAPAEPAAGDTAVGFTPAPPSH